MSYIVLKENSIVLSPTDIVVFVGDTESRTFTVQKKTDEGANESGAGEVIKIQPQGGLVTIDKTEFVLDSNGQGTFTIGPESKRGTLGLVVECNDFAKRSVAAVKLEFKHS